MVNILEKFNEKQVQTLKNSREFPNYKAGDTVKVSYKIVEGDTSRIQVFEGVVIAKEKQKKDFNSTLTVRKISHGVGVERKFLLHSPLVEKIEIVYYDMFFLLIIEIIVLFIFVERRKNESEKQLLIRKMKGAIIFISIFVWGNLVGKKQYVFVVECIMATIELMLYKKNKKFY